jgi:hypothetical protein
MDAFARILVTYDGTEYLTKKKKKKKKERAKQIKIKLMK